MGARRRSGIREVATAAGVSVGTVSNVLNNPELVSAGTRERVGRVMRELGFVRNGQAHQLRVGQSPAAGVMVLGMANDFWAEVARGVEDRLTAHGLMMILCSSNGEVLRQSRYLTLLEEQGVRGVLVAPAHADLAQLQEIVARGTSVVLLDYASPTAHICSVSVDDVAGGQLAAEHLLSLGHRRIALLNGSPEIQQCADRSAGIRAALTTAGLDPRRHLREERLAGEPSFELIEAAVGRVLDDSEPPTAIACVSDTVALSALRALRTRGVRVPEQVALIGYDDLPFASELDPPLTSIRQPRRRIGSTAADLMLDEANETHRHQQVVFSPELIIRASTTT